ncbi:sugar O-acetyltransferase [Ruegeria jejuensis]|uniref:sugar O-acetyltransferase n=1 Tax=Ruegeria jejuensis TaxID=3233338 RepID=UPI00355B7E07
MSQKAKMLTGEWYSCLDHELEMMRQRARNAVYQHNTLPPDTRGPMGSQLAELFAHVGQNCVIEAPFHCSYGVNLSLGDLCYLNAGCVILDSAPVRIGAGTMLGPAVQIYCAQHAKDPIERAKGLEIALPVTLGDNVWIGGGAIILPGVSIGENAIVGAGSVVTRDVAPNQTVMGNPAQVR